VYRDRTESAANIRVVPDAWCERPRHDGGGEEVILVTTMVRWDPFRELGLMERSMRSLGMPLLQVPALPAADIYETEDLFVVAMDIAGVAPDGFTVTFDAGILSVSGERREQASGRREYHAMEVKVGPFERRFRFPKRVDPASLKATYELGFLEIRLTKVSDRPQSVRVDVEAK